MSVQTRLDAPPTTTTNPTPPTTPTTPGVGDPRSPTAAEVRSADRRRRKERRRERDLERALRRQAATRALQERDLAYQQALLRSGVYTR